MILDMNINTNIEINSVKDLNKLRLLVEVNNLDKPNFSELGRQLGVDRRTAKKYYEGNIEKEHLLPLPHDKVCSFYKNVTMQVKVNTNSLFKYKKNMYSVSPDLIGKNITIQVIENDLHVYYNKKLITIHSISRNKVNYHSDHHTKMLKITFKGQEDVSEYANKHLKELEKFNEQLSEIM